MPSVAGQYPAPFQLHTLHHTPITVENTFHGILLRLHIEILQTTLKAIWIQRENLASSCFNPQNQAKLSNFYMSINVERKIKPSLFITSDNPRTSILKLLSFNNKNIHDYITDQYYSCHKRCQRTLKNI